MIKFKPIWIVIFLLTSLFCQLLKAKELTSGEKILVTTNFKEVRSLNDLPNSVVKYINDKISNRIAPKEADFRGTDVSMGRNLPTRRMIFAGRHKNYSLVYFEHGGIGYHGHIYVFEEKNNTANVVYATTAGIKPTPMPKLIEMVKQGKIEDITEEIKEIEQSPNPQSNFY